MTVGYTLHSYCLKINQTVDMFGTLKHYRLTASLTAFYNLHKNFQKNQI